MTEVVFYRRKVLPAEDFSPELRKRRRLLLSKNQITVMKTPFELYDSFLSFVSQ